MFSGLNPASRSTGAAWACLPAIVLIAAWVTGACAPASASQADPDSMLRFSHSEWETEYDAPGGRRVKARVTLRGSEGTYFLPEFDMTGRLSDINYYESFPHAQVLNIDSTRNEPTPAIVGLFNLQGATGFFVFRKPDFRGKMDGYSGSWVRVENRTALVFGGSWDGTLIRRIAQPAPVAPIAAALPADAGVPDAIAPVRPESNPGAERTRARSEHQDQALEAVDTAAIRGAINRAEQAAPGQVVVAGPGREKAGQPPAGWQPLPQQPPLIGLQGATDPWLSEDYTRESVRMRQRVCRFEAKAAFFHPKLGGQVSKGSGFGTGILVSSSLVLTAGHVVPSNEIASFAQVSFKRDDFEKLTYHLPADCVLVHSDPTRLDYSLLRVKADADGSPPGASLTFYPLEKSLRHKGSLYHEGLLVNILHYPYGGEGLISDPRGRMLQFIKPGFLAYDARTAPGSSGGPIFNDYWWLLALHSGMKQESDEPVDFYKDYARGIRIDAIVDDLRSRKIPGLLEELGIPPE